MTVNERFEAVCEYLKDANPEALLADGFEDALIGHVVKDGKITACYDATLCCKILQTRDGMTEEEASEYFEFNVVGSCMGENSPAFLFEPEL